MAASLTDFHPQRLILAFRKRIFPVGTFRKPFPGKFCPHRPVRAFLLQHLPGSRLHLLQMLLRQPAGFPGRFRSRKQRFQGFQNPVPYPDFLLLIPLAVAVGYHMQAEHLPGNLPLQGLLPAGRTRSRHKRPEKACQKRNRPPGLPDSSSHGKFLLPVEDCLFSLSLYRIAAGFHHYGQAVSLRRYQRKFLNALPVVQGAVDLLQNQRLAAADTVLVNACQIFSQ